MVRACTDYHIKGRQLMGYLSFVFKVMVRPRVGDFVYSQSEIEVMLEDIALFKQIGVAGVVLGVLTSEGEVDVPQTTR